MLAQSFETEAGIVRVVTTQAADGDFAVAQDASIVEPYRRAIIDAPWTWLRQVHGATVVTASAPGHQAGSVADAVVTRQISAPIAVTTADCSPVVLVGTGAIGVAHAGWKGLLAGVVEATAEALRDLGSEPVATFLGPCIQPGRYEFSAADLDSVAARYGEAVRGVTHTGEPALDMTASVQAACREAGWPIPVTPPCTSSSDYFSHRTRQDPGRQTTVAWIEAS